MCMHQHDEWEGLKRPLERGGLTQRGRAGFRESAGRISKSDFVGTLGRGSCSAAAQRKSGASSTGWLTRSTCLFCPQHKSKCGLCAPSPQIWCLFQACTLCHFYPPSPWRPPAPTAHGKTTAATRAYHSPKCPSAWLMASSVPACCSSSSLPHSLAT